MQHLDEGTIHTWIDGELSPEQGGEIEAHVAECPECAAMVAEAHGLVAASTRILTALDDVPGGVIPSVPDIAPAQIVRRRWYQRTDVRAAAALLLVAGTSLVMVQRGADSSASRAMLATDDKGQPTPAAGAEASAAGPATGNRRAMADAAPNSAFIGVPEQAKPAASERVSGTPARGAEAKSGFASPRDQVAQENARADAPSPKLQARDESRRLMEEAPRKRAADVASALPASPLARAGAAAPPIVAAPAEDRLGTKAPDFVKGRVIDKQSGKGVPQAQVLVEGTTLDGATDKDGNFKIANVPPGDQRLRVRRLGYEVATVPLAKESRENEAANTVALTPSKTRLEEVVVSGAVAAPAMSTLGAAMSKTAEAGALRIVRADSTAGIKRTTYEVSKGVEVVLTDSPVETAAERDAAIRQKVAAPPSAPALPVPPAAAGQRETAVSGQVAGATVLSARSAQVNTISWTDRGRKYVLTGRTVIDQDRVV